MEDVENGEDYASGGPGVMWEISVLKYLPLNFALNLKLLKDISLKSGELYLGLGHGIVEQNCLITVAFMMIAGTSLLAERIC